MTSSEAPKEFGNLKTSKTVLLVTGRRLGLPAKNTPSYSLSVSSFASIAQLVEHKNKNPYTIYVRSASRSLWLSLGAGGSNPSRRTIQASHGVQGDPATKLYGLVTRRTTFETTCLFPFLDGSNVSGLSWLRKWVRFPHVSARSRRPRRALPGLLLSVAISPYLTLSASNDILEKMH